MTQEPSNEDPVAEQNLRSAEFVLGLLTPAEHAEFAAKLPANPSARAQVNFWRTRLASLDRDFSDVPAPAAVFSRLEQRLFGNPAQTAWWNSLLLWRTLTAAAAVLALVVISFNLATPRPDAKGFAAQLVAALSAEGSNVQIVALYNATSGQVHLTTLAGKPLPGKDFELWAIEGANAPRSMGVIPTTGPSAEVTVAPAIAQAFGPGITLAISLEPKGGSPTGAPTGPVVAAGKAQPI